MNATTTTKGWKLPTSAMVLALAFCGGCGEDTADRGTPVGTGGSHGDSTQATGGESAGTGGATGGSNDASAGSPNTATGSVGSSADASAGGTSANPDSAMGGAVATTDPTGGAPSSTGSGGAAGVSAGTVAEGGTTTSSTAGTASSTESAGSSGVSAGPGTVAAPVLCVFDYDLTLSTHACTETEGDPASLCRVADDCGVYGWSDQCIATHAREAVAECVRRDAYIGIASHSPFEGCWNDKITPIVTENQFPEFTESPRYASPSADFSYPAIDEMDNWNCEDCAYQMETIVSKSAGISRIMRHYGMDPENPGDRQRVFFWDDDPNNISNVETNMPEVISVTVVRHGDTGAEGGCGITPEDITEAWSQL